MNVRKRVGASIIRQQSWLVRLLHAELIRERNKELILIECILNVGLDVVRVALNAHDELIKNLFTVHAENVLCNHPSSKQRLGDC